MRILFVHQNFPGQFKHLARVLSADPSNQVTAFILQPPGRATEWHGVQLVSYQPARGTSPSIHPWVSDFETKVIRGEAVFRAAFQMKKEGYSPDIIIAHPGWGETLFLKEVWPNARLGVYCEFFYHASGADVGFDPEFPTVDPGDICRLRLKNTTNILHFDIAEEGLSPTRWQASTFPSPFRNRITVVHDGIDCATISPNGAANLTLNGSLTLTKKDPIVTFVNRNLEPYRGYHIFMRSLPELLRRCPNVRVLIVGGDHVSYGAPPSPGRKWKDIFFDEVRPQIGDENLKRVHFLGNIRYEYFILLLQISTVHVYLTYPFVLSWSLLEAMSVGCAIVASDTQPLHEAITHNETGLLVNFFDPHAIADSVCGLLDQPKERERLGENARKFALANYDLKTVCLPRQLAWVNGLARR